LYFCPSIEALVWLSDFRDIKEDEYAAEEGLDNDISASVILPPFHTIENFEDREVVPIPTFPLVSTYNPSFPPSLLIQFPFVNKFPVIVWFQRLSDHAEIWTTQFVSHGAHEGSNVSFALYGVVGGAQKTIPVILTNMIRNIILCLKVNMLFFIIKIGLRLVYLNILKK
jgi:hypothetical protein